MRIVHRKADTIEGVDIPHKAAAEAFMWRLLQLNFLPGIAQQVILVLLTRCGTFELVEQGLGIQTH